MENILEIREFVDNRGEVIKGEVVNVEDEMNGMIASIERLQAMKQTRTSSSAQSQEETEEKQQIDLEQLKKSLKGSLTPDVSSLDDEMRFIREIAEISTDNISEAIDDDWILDLERRERGEPSPKAATLQKTQTNTQTQQLTQSPAQNILKKSSSGSNGWKKGFLGSDKSSNSKKLKSVRIQETKNAEVDNTSALSVVRTELSNVHQPNEKAENFRNKTPIDQTTFPEVSQPPQPSKPKPKPFSGSIIERFP